MPKEVVVDILSRLPTKCLIRFSSVSKLWNSLITSPNFINSNLNQSLKNPIYSFDNLPLVIVRQCIGSIASFPPEEHYELFTDTGEEGNTIDGYPEIPFPLKSRHFRFYYLVGYVKGLFCFFEPDNCFLWNPSIRKSISFPEPGITQKTLGSFSDYLGFGFDSQSNDYKVVGLVFLRGTIPSELVEAPLVEVYSLNAGLWKIKTGAGDSFPLGFRPKFRERPTACLEGALHFAAKNGLNWRARLIVLFDLRNEVFKTTSLPADLGNVRTGIRTMVFRGLLSLLCHNHCDPANRFCSIWIIMKEYGIVDSWDKYVKVDLTGGIQRVVGIRKKWSYSIGGRRNTAFGAFFI
ncbi:hypothetical protein RHMOL_Rhmol11G0108000 [Rhododendron molle]|uniref:Uncharacterized protein n=1 Tax=Rhododendron molle TaxID=49168 RepID=A0ACC0LR05_RHOML|nr:hypothetical protein RHMOL_Rhmol11G0108000 [Rhododendron molle]